MVMAESTISGKLPDIADVSAASTRIAGEAVRTPLLSSGSVNDLLGLNVFFKAENLQRTGSFKFRGAYNALSQLDARQRKAGIVACSSGNHAQGVAEAARILGLKAVLVVPSDAPDIKIQRARRSGAHVVEYDRQSDDRDAIARRIQEESSATLIHPYENAAIIAGQGTCGLEIAEDLRALGQYPDRLLICTGGGGLTAGVTLAIKDSFPEIAIHSVEPEGFDDYRRSLASGRIMRNERLGGSACDALLTPAPGELGFAINHGRLAEGFAVGDEEAFAAMRFAFAELKLVLEPGGAVALAALIRNAPQWQGQTVVCVLSGGNVDPALFARVIAGESA